ncbi:polar amino acid transport system substrate-binding protein [Gammaproteobacteria bacterium]
MNRKNILLNTVCVALILISTVSYAKIKTIRFATRGTYAPFSKLHTNQELHGFDIDIANEVCKRLQAQCTISVDKIGNMIPSLKAGKYDAWISAIPVNEEHKKEIAFSDVYFSGMAALLATSASTFSALPIELKGKTIGVEAATSHIPYIKSIYGDTIKIKTFSTGRDACLALKDGKVDAVLDDEVVLNHWRMEYADKKHYRLIGLPVKHLDLIKQQYAIAVAKDNIKLITAINQALAEIKFDGTCDRLIEKHF